MKLIAALFIALFAAGCAASSVPQSAPAVAGAPGPASIAGYVAAHEKSPLLTGPGCQLYWPQAPYRSFPGYTKGVTQSYIFWLAAEQIYAEVWCDNALPGAKYATNGIPPNLGKAYFAGDPTLYPGGEAWMQLDIAIGATAGNPRTVHVPLSYSAGLAIVSEYVQQP